MRAAGYDQSQYCTVNASVNFLVGMTRPDLRFINGKVNKYNANPGIQHFKAQKHAQRFIKGTKHYGIEFNWFAGHLEPPDGPLHMVAYSDRASPTTSTRRARLWDSSSRSTVPRCLLLVG